MTNKRKVDERHVFGEEHYGETHTAHGTTCLCGPLVLVGTTRAGIALVIIRHRSDAEMLKDKCSRLEEVLSGNSAAKHEGFVSMRKGYVADLRTKRGCTEVQPLFVRMLERHIDKREQW